MFSDIHTSYDPSACQSPKINIRDYLRNLVTTTPANNCLDYFIEKEIEEHMIVNNKFNVPKRPHWSYEKHTNPLLYNSTLHMMRDFQNLSENFRYHFADFRRYSNY